MSYSKQNFRSGDTLYASQLNAMDDEIAVLEAEVESTKNMVGSPLTASTAASMTDQTKIYVYTGSETGYTAGHWYYYNGTAWTDGGVYNSVAVNTDTSLTVSGQAADSKAVGDAIDDLDSDLTDVKSDLNQTRNLEDISILSGTYSGTRYVIVPVDIPAGSYTIDVDNITTTDTDADYCSVRFVYDESNALVVHLDRGDNIRQDITLTADVTSIGFYASSSAATAMDDTFSYTGFKLLQGYPLKDAISAINERIGEVSDDLNDRVDEVATQISGIDSSVAFADGKIKNAVASDNLLQLTDSNKSNTRTHNGITFVYNPATDTFTVNGQATGTASYSLLSTGDDLPFYIKPGETYYLVCRTSNTYVKFECMYQVSGSWSYVSYTKDAVFQIPATATDVGFRIVVYDTAHAISNATIKVSLRALSYDDIAQNMDLFKMMGTYPYDTSARMGVTFTYDEATDKFTLNGTATGLGNYPILASGSDAPFFLIPGETYYMTFDADENITINFMYQVGTTWNYLYYSSDAIITIPADANDYGFRLQVVNGITYTNASISMSLTKVEGKKYIDAAISEAMPAGSTGENDNVFELYTEFEANNSWWLADGTLDGVAGNHKHTQKLLIRPETIYYTGYKIDGAACYGLFYDVNGEIIAPLTSEMITEHSYKIPDATGELTSYVKMYKFTTPANAKYLSYNWSYLAVGNNFRYRSYISSKPIFATQIYGDLVIKRNDPIWQKFKNRKLCIIGTSQVMIDRLSRTGKFDGPSSSDATQYISGVQEYLMPWWGTVDTYGYSSAAMMYSESESPKSIYTRVVTDQLDLSGYDDYFITHSSSGLTASNIGDLTGYDDLGSNTTFIGALRQIIDYIYTQNPKANVFVQTRLIRAVFSNSTTYANVQLANEAVRKVAKLLGLVCVDTANESGFNYYNAPYWCYDANGHPNQVGNYYIGLHMRKTLLGV